MEDPIYPAGRQPGVIIFSLHKELEEFRSVAGLGDDLFDLTDSHECAGDANLYSTVNPDLLSFIKSWS